MRSSASTGSISMERPRYRLDKAPEDRTTERSISVERVITVKKTRYELEPVAECTLVRETFDWSKRVAYLVGQGTPYTRWSSPEG
jgi:hypothetical protein